MKFKYLIIVFSILIFFILSILTVVQFIFPEILTALNLQFIILPLIILMLGILVFLGIFLLFNYRLFSLLEREDWPALAYYLEQKIFVKNRYSNRKVQLLASSYMVISDYISVLKLESKAALAKPSVIEKNVLVFGSARIFSGKYEEAADFFMTHQKKGRLKKRDKEWVRWFCSFSHLLNGAFSKVEPEFLILAETSHDALITGVSSYFLVTSLKKHSLRPSECLAAAEKGRKRLMASFKNEKDWAKEVDRMAPEIHIAIIRKYIDEAGKWLFFTPQKPAGLQADNKETEAVLNTLPPSKRHKNKDDSHPIISDKKYNEEIANLDSSNIHDKRDTL